MKLDWDRWLARFFFTAGICLLVLAGYCYFAPEPGPALESETDIKVSAAVAGQSQVVAIKLHNQSGWPIRVLGLVEC